jgi:hypothetical protein
MKQTHLQRMTSFPSLNCEFFYLPIDFMCFINCIFSFCQEQDEKRDENIAKLAHKICPPSRFPQRQKT